MDELQKASRPHLRDYDLDMRTRLELPGMLARRLHEIAFSLERVAGWNKNQLPTFEECKSIAETAAADLRAIARLLKPE